MSTLSFYFFIFYVFYAVRIFYTFGCHYPTNWNSLGHCICVHQGKISAAAGLEPGALGLSVNHAANELLWRHGAIGPIFCIYNITKLINGGPNYYNAIAANVPAEIS